MLNRNKTKGFTVDVKSAPNENSNIILSRKQCFGSRVLKIILADYPVNCRDAKNVRNLKT